ncbi:MAG: hypothetical protein RR346_08570 [Bacteroidales bacterium]
MKGKERISYMANPAWGLLPFLLYAFLVNFINYKICLFISLAFGLGCLWFLPFFLRRKVFPLFLFITIWVLGVCCIVALIPFPPTWTRYLRLLPDSLLLLVVSEILLDRRSFIGRLFRMQKRFLKFSIKANLYEYFFLLRLLKRFLIFYLVIVLVYLIFLKQMHSPEIHAFMYGQLRLLLILALFSFSYFRLYLLNRKFRNEDWLPIIDENAQVIGRIARSVSYQFKEKYLHPQVRILFFYKGMLYLKPRDALHIYNKGKYDTPLAKDLRFMQDFPSAVSELMKMAGFSSLVHPRFFSRYLFEREHVRRMMFLYIMTVKDESCFAHKIFHKGKLWTEQEIDNNIGKGVFGEAFEEEFELLKTTVFPVMKMMSKNE